MARKRPPFSFPELEARGRGAILRSSEEIRAEQEQLEAQGREAPPEEGLSDINGPQADKTTSGQVDKPTSRQVAETTSGSVGLSPSPQALKTTKPRVEKYTTHLKPETIKAIKRVAFESERKDYEVVQEALDAYLRRIKGQ
jgi:hypothetical protein